MMPMSEILLREVVNKLRNERDGLVSDQNRVENERTQVNADLKKTTAELDSTDKKINELIGTISSLQKHADERQLLVNKFGKDITKFENFRIDLNLLKEKFGFLKSDIDDLQLTAEVGVLDHESLAKEFSAFQTKVRDEMNAIVEDIKE